MVNHKHLQYKLLPKQQQQKEHFSLVLKFNFQLFLFVATPVALILVFFALLSAELLIILMETKVVLFSEKNNFFCADKCAPNTWFAEKPWNSANHFCMFLKVEQNDVLSHFFFFALYHFYVQNE